MVKAVSSQGIACTVLEDWLHQTLISHGAAGGSHNSDTFKNFMTAISLQSAD
jgi:hypothetical protein